MIDDKTTSAVRALARMGSFRAASEAVGTSPASFSRYIAQAEEYAGQTLFERGGRHTILTSAGREFMVLLDKLDVATRMFEAGVGRLTETGPEMLNIGCGPLTTRAIISPILADMLEAHPDMRARVMVSASKAPLEALRMGQLDVAVCDLTHTPDLSDLEIQVLRKEPVSFWAHPAHPIFEQSQVSVKDVFRSPFMTAHLHKHWRAAVANVLGGDEEAWQIVSSLPQIESDDFGFICDLACRTNLICGGMAADFAEHAALGRLKQVQTKETMTWNICGARRKTASFPILDQFWERLRDQFGT
ncbi:LysR family transcriptional regulator [Shimia abyssi]|uniref:LysR family transcriptional regulator n=1 Tax=Shimia abyssi TaxID=1662395 RepID=A0A2P8F5U1_9RHOB|nr:LysR family transcriptional regulator [Shimia abyssi]PSL17093.1 LysR family transcriptional regulator [Shimia abyssi]